MKAVLLAAGLGTRLGSLTADKPKILVEVAGVPMLHRQLNYLQARGVTEVAINTHAHTDRIADAVCEWNGRLGVTLFPEASLLGTAGAVKAMRLFVGEEPFVVLYGDVLTSAHFPNMARVLDGKLAVIGWHRAKSSVGCGVLTLDGLEVASFVEKPREFRAQDHVKVNSGVCVMSPEIMGFLPERGDLGADVWPRLASGRLLNGYAVAEPSIDIGTPAGLFAANCSLHPGRYLDEAEKLCRSILVEEIEEIVAGIVDVRDREARVFVLGVGGGAANAAHAVNDLRKLCGVEAYAPTDSPAELTARTNDEGWDTTFVEWLKVSRLDAADALLVWSVGGGSLDPLVSPNIVAALDYAGEIGASVYGVVGYPGGRLNEQADAAVVLLPPADLRTPLVESFQMLVLHAIVSHPALAVAEAKWESLR